MRILLAAVLTCAVLAQGAGAAEADQPMSYNDGVFCESVLGLASALAEIGGAPPAQVRELEGLSLAAFNAAKEIGAREGMSAAAIQLDIDDADENIIAMSLNGELDGDKPGTYTLEVYVGVCTDIMKSYAQSGR